MDERGFIFTTDATLALIVIMIVSASISTYLLAPYFMSQDHEHLQALASDALETMDQDGTLTRAAVKYNQNTTQGNSDGDAIINERLDSLIPENIAYKLNILGHNIERNKFSLVNNDTATAIRITSGPPEGYLGRAWYKQEEVPIVDKQVNVISTVWNFHNYLSNFQPWNNGFYSRQYWGISGSNPGSPVNIEFSIPEDVTLHNAFFLQGTNNVSARNNNNPSFGVQVNINNGHLYGNTSRFTPLYPRVNNQGQITDGIIYNYKGNINATDLHGGENVFNVFFNYQNMLRSNYQYNVPWFSIIANYTTTIQVPDQTQTIDEKFPDAAGLARPFRDTDGAYGKIYNISSGQVTPLTTQRSVSWNAFSNNRNILDNYDDGVPFYFTDVTNGVDGSAVSVVKEFTIPDNATPFDGYVSINAYAAVDKAMVEVWDGTQWRAIFCSSEIRETPNSPVKDFSAVDGYGNTPGIIYIDPTYLHHGLNKVRITVWDDVPSSDYDLVGLVDSKLYISWSTLPIKWQNFAFNSYQSGSSQTASQERTFSIGPDAATTYMFVGVGTTTQHVKIDLRSSGTDSWANIYDEDTVPYMVNIAALDAAGPHKITTGTPGNFTLKEGTDYRVRITVTAPLAWKSGDGGSSPGTYGNPTIFSGTRVAVIYKYLQNRWNENYSPDAQTAKDIAKEKLIADLHSLGKYDVDESQIKTEALYTGDLPNSIPVRLDLWS